VEYRRKSRELGQSKKTFGNHESGDVGQQLGDSPSNMVVDRLKLEAKRGVVVEPNSLEDPVERTGREFLASYWHRKYINPCPENPS